MSLLELQLNQEVRHRKEISLKQSLKTTFYDGSPKRAREISSMLSILSAIRENEEADLELTLHLARVTDTRFTHSISYF